MRNIKLRFFGSIRAAAKKEESDYETYPGQTVYDLLKSLSDCYGKTFRDEIFLQSADLPRDDVVVLINGVTVKHTALGETTAAPGDVITLLPTFPGGG